MPALTRFTYGAINPLTVDHYTERQISEYRVALQQYLAGGGTL